MSTLMISLSKKLMSFQEADTNSTTVGFVQPGDYEVLDSKMKFPNSDTDYTQITVKGKGDVWICSRWKNSNYVDVIASPQPRKDDAKFIPDAAPIANNLATVGDLLSRINFNDSDEAIEESTLVSELKAYDGFIYDLKNPTYPHPLKGVKVPLGPPAQNNCCTFVEGLLVKSWADRFPEFKWDNKRHNQMMITSDKDYFSPITALVENGMAEKIDDIEKPPQPWTAIQAWRKEKSATTEWSGGHTFLIVDYHEATGKVLTLESNKGFKLNGVGFRQIGMASDFDHRPPKNWWELPAVWTWEKMKSTYKFRQMATLKVKGRSWSGIV
jgi:hypothetical protein